jgi:hypothetical protein
MPVPAKKSTKPDPVLSTQLDRDYERIMRLARLASPSTVVYRGNVELPAAEPQVETITTYGAHVTTG